METGAFRSDPYTRLINDKITVADTDNTIVFTQYQQKASEGKAAFTIYHNGSLASGSTGTLLLVNPSGSGKTINIITVSVNSTDQGEIGYVADPSYSGGTALAVYSFEVGGSYSGVAKAYADPTLSGGTTLPSEVCPGGSGRRAIGGANSGYVAFILPEGHSIAFQFKNTSSNSNDVSIKVEWWEE